MQSLHSKEHRTELDSHADTCVVGQDTALLLHDFGTTVRVKGYDNTGPTAEHRTVGAAVAYDHPETGETLMLIIHQAILIPTMDVNLLSTMQLRDHGVRVNDEPKSMVPTPTDDHNALLLPKLDGDTTQYRIPMALHGVTTYFPTRKPTVSEFQACPIHIELTSEQPEWDPGTDRFATQEATMLDSRGRLREPYGLAPIHSQHSDFDYVFEGTTLGDYQSIWQRGTTNTHHVKLMRNWGIGVDEAKRTVAAFRTSNRSPDIDMKQLAQNWSVSETVAQNTLQVTTQNGIRTLLHPTLSRRFRTNDRQLRYRRLAHDMFTDTLEASVSSWHRRNRYAQVFATRFGWTRVFPMRTKGEAHEGLSLLAQRDGVPPTLIMDGSKEQTKGTFRKKTKEMGTHVKQIEPHSPWQNAAEGAIRELKRGAGRKMAKTKSPACLWDHCLELESHIRSNTALSSYELQGQVPETIVSGQTADISPFAEHAWYEWVKWYDQQASHPQPKETLGRWLGPALDIGPAMTAKILKANGQVAYRSTYRGLTQDETDSEIEKRSREEFDQKIRQRLGDPVKNNGEDQDPDMVTPEYQLYEDDFEEQRLHIPDIDNVTPEEHDNYIGCEVKLPHAGAMQTGRVRKRAKTSTGALTGTRHHNPILDTRTYEVEFPDGELAEYSANVIAENVYSECDPEGNQHLLLETIVDHDSNQSAVQKADQFVIVSGRQHRRKTTKGWKVCARWRDGTTSWERLADMKESYPIQVAEYAVTKGIEDEPAFAWWAPHVLKKRDRIIAAVGKRYHKRTHKFGFEVPKTVKRALEIDTENGNHLWRDAIAKEMSAVRIAFRILDDGKDPPPGHSFMECHIIFDIKLDGFKRKARLVAGGHMVDTPAIMTYASVVSRDTVRIALTIAALNDLEVKASDVQNAFLTAPCEEKIFTILGPEFGADQGKRATIVRALYGLKSAGRSFSRHLADCLRTLDYTPCKADPDLWYKATTRPDDGYKYYSYILLYVDDCLCIHHDAEPTLKQLDKYFQMKPGSIGDPDIYLGAKLRQVRLDNGVEAWAMSSSKYVQEAVRNVEEYLDKNFGRKLPGRANAPWPRDYHSELDTTPELGHDLANYYQSQVGILHWMVELGRVDIITEVSTLASHMALPREGHLEAAFQVFAYLKAKHNARLVLDPTYHGVDEKAFQNYDNDWVHFYGDIKEAIPTDCPTPRGREVDLRLYVDSDHAGDKKLRRSRTGFFIFLNSALVAWLSKKQATVETSVFGAEFVAMKQGMETVRGLRYKLRMMGVPISGPTHIFGDNMSVIHNTQRPESTLKKKSNQICYHAIRESVAMGESLTGHIGTHENPADLATKIIPAGQKRSYLVSKLLRDIFDEVN